MDASSDNCVLYQTISDMIGYCQDNDLPQTKKMLTVAIAMLSQEEGENNSLLKGRLLVFPMEHVTSGIL